MNFNDITIMAQNRQTTPLLEHKSKVTVVKKRKHRNIGT